jgi:hypothetical protein
MKAFFAAVTTTCVFVFIAFEYPLLIAAITAVATAALLAGLIALSLLRRSTCRLTIALVCVAYLVVADGGTAPAAVRYLPIEHAIELVANRCGTVLDSGRRRSRSLSRWLVRVFIEPTHKDYPRTRNATRRPESSAIDSLDSELDIDDLLGLVDQTTATGPLVTVSLPTLAMTVTNTHSITRSRNDPSNRPLYIIGHCIFVLLFVVLAIAYWRRNDDAV